MNQKSDKAKLAFFSESIKERMEIEVRRIGHLYQAGRIGGIKGHEKLHQATKDLSTLYWRISAVIGREHSAIDAIHRINNSGKVWPDGRNYLSKRTADAIDAFLLASKLFRSGDDVTNYSLLRDAGKLARRLIRVDAMVLRQDINDLLYTARKHPSTPVSEEVVIPEEVPEEDMLVKKNV